MKKKMKDTENHYLWYLFMVEERIDCLGVTEFTECGLAFTA